MHEMTHHVKMDHDNDTLSMKFWEKKNQTSCKHVSVQRMSNMQTHQARNGHCANGGKSTVNIKPRKNR
ncbi:hypothetical protein HYC85_013113 [Camellia sinensis]|uniref:Uncharacterized protein n=1 Tax=Camellia sinensis TaxID=4442 RepID=A0A7J7HDX2_CAMSI|nr:hypothetical protein HYC85_013113 [Camellia sinensis]